MSATGGKPPGAAFWDDRYGGAGFAYGTAPNRWLRERAGAILPGGRVLSLGEGEGRNAVRLAERGRARPGGGGPRGRPADRGAGPVRRGRAARPI